MGEFQHFIGRSAICTCKAEVTLPNITASIYHDAKTSAVGATARVRCAFSIFTRWCQPQHILGAAYNAIGIGSARSPVVVICDPCRTTFIESNETGAVHLLAVAVVTQRERPGIGRAVQRRLVSMLALFRGVTIQLARILIRIVDGIRGFGLPTALGGFIIAALVLSPEALGAIKSALRNQLQRSINIFLGSVAATIGLTIPAVLAISIITGEPLVLGLHPQDALLLGTTLAVSMITYNSGRTNIMLGAVHLVLFATYIMLIFDDTNAI
jgi:hypothetical protein